MRYIQMITTYIKFPEFRKRLKLKSKWISGV